jgi:alpha-glucosidase (family GH31 glycosyl hydrolase)
LQKKLEEEQVNLLIYINPMLTNTSNKGNVRNNYYLTASANDYFIKDQDGNNFETRAVSDFSASLLNFNL